MEAGENPTIPLTPVPDEGGADQSVINELRAKRDEVQPDLSKTKTIEVPGYDGKLGIEYRYIDSEVTEAISKKVTRDTRATKGAGMTLLASLDTLARACSRVVIRDNSESDWRPMQPDPVRFTPKLSDILGYSAADEREVILGLFGSEHAVIQQNIQLSRWLADVTKDVDDDFLGLF